MPTPAASLRGRRGSHIVWYDEFKKLSDEIGQVNLHLAQALATTPTSELRSADRMNDLWLIVGHVFALEACYWPHLKGSNPAPLDTDGLKAGMVRRLHRKAECQGKLDPLLPHLRFVDPVFGVRNLYAHAFGRRRGLKHPDWLPPQKLKEYGFEADGPEDDLDTPWWPLRHVAFSACVSPIMKLAEVIRDHIKP